MTLSAPPQPARAGRPPADLYVPPWWLRVVKTVVRGVLLAYARVWHGAEMLGMQNVPPTGPALAMTNHASLVDVPLLLALDPFPNSTLVAKASLFRIPVVREVLRAWGSIPVERDGRDLAGVRAILAALKRGQLVAVAAEGRRTRSGGRLEPVNPILARLAASTGVPVIPLGIVGSWKVLPPGAWLPRRGKVVVRVGEPFRLPKGMDEQEGARLIRARIAALLPPEQQPLDLPSADLPSLDPPPARAGVAAP